jgi:hypothetical protein
MSRDLSRLEELVKAVLPNVAEENFNLQTWQDIDSEGSFTCCACGWAAHHVPFIVEGLGIQEADVWSRKKYVFVYRTNISFYHGFTAVCAFFSLSLKDAHYLFDKKSYLLGSQTTSKEVIQRVTKFINRSKNNE